MNLPRQPIFILLFLSIFSACSGMQKAAVSTTGGLIYKASYEIETESNWDLFREAVPGTLKLMEGLSSLHPTNKDLMVSIIKGYAGYSFAVHETLALDEQLRGVSKGPHYQMSLALFSKAVTYGLQYLENEGVSYSDLLKASRTENGVNAILDKHLSSDSSYDQELVIFTAQSMASMINMQRDQMLMVAQLPVAKALFDWVCKVNPEIHFGACDIFYGAYVGGRPAMLGGNPEEGEKIFFQAMEKYPHNWLIRQSYLQYILLQKQDTKAIKEQMGLLAEYHQLHMSEQNWRPPTLSKGVHPAFEQKRIRFFQTIAMKRYEILNDHYSKITK